MDAHCPRASVSPSVKWDTWGLLPAHRPPGLGLTGPCFEFRVFPSESESRMFSSNRTNGDKKELKEEKPGGAHSQGLRTQAGTAISLLEIKMQGNLRGSGERGRGELPTPARCHRTHTQNRAGPGSRPGWVEGSPVLGCRQDPGNHNPEALPRSGRYQQPHVSHMHVRFEGLRARRHKALCW